MTFTALDWSIILDTLSASRGINDGGTVFHFTPEARIEVANKVIEYMGESAIPTPERTEP